MSTQGFTIGINEDDFKLNNLTSISNTEHDDEDDTQVELELRDNLEDVVGPSDLSSDEESNFVRSVDYNKFQNEVSQITQGYTVKFMEEDLKLNTNKNFSTILEEDEDDVDAELELRDNLQDVVGPDDISSDEESKLSDDNINTQNELVSNNELPLQADLGKFLHFNGKKEVHCNQELTLSEEVNRHPFDDSNSSGDFSQLSLPDSIRDFNINLSLNKSLSIDEQVPNVDNNLSLFPSIVNYKHINRFDGFSTSQLQDVYLSSGTEKEKLHILYDVRGREIDDLKKQLEYLQVTSKSEVKNISDELKRHKIKLEMMSASEKGLKSLLVKYESKVRKYDTDLVVKNNYINKLESANNIIKTELEVAENTILSLEEQVVKLKSVKSLAQSQQSHDDFIQKLNNLHKDDLEKNNNKYKVSLSKIGKLEQELEKLEFEKQTGKERQLNIIQCKDLTIRSLQLSLKNVKSDISNSDAEMLKDKNIELQMKLETLQNNYELTKKNLDCCDLVNKMRTYKETVPAEDSLEHFGLIKAIDFNNLSSANNKCLTEEVTPKESSNNLEIIVRSLQNSVFCNKKIRGENIHLQKIIGEKDNEIKDLQIIIKEQRTLNEDQRRSDEDHGKNELINALKSENNVLNKKLEETLQQIQIEKCTKYTNTEDTLYRNYLDNEKKDKASEIVSNCKDLSGSLNKYQNNLENEKLKTQERENNCKNKQLISTVNNVAGSTTNSNLANCGNEDKIEELKLKNDTYVKEIETIKIGKKQLIDHYENAIEKITETLLDKEGEIQEVKNNVKTQISTFHMVIHELNLNRTKLSEKNDTLEKKLVLESEYYKGKLSKYREKYQRLGTSFDKYRVKVEERMKYYQGVLKEMEIVYVKDLDEVRSWLNNLRLNIIKNIDTSVVEVKLKKHIVTHDIIKYHVHVLKELRVLVLELNIKDAEKYFIHFK